MTEHPTEGWPDIVELDGFDLPPFPTHALPEPLRTWVEAESTAMQTPTDLAGLLAIACCSAAIAKHYEVEARPGWREPVNVFVAVLLDPANRKSAVFSDATLPLREYERDQVELQRADTDRARCQRAIEEQRLAKLQRDAISGEESKRRQAENEAAELAERLGSSLPPALPRLLVEDATPESLEILLQNQGGRIASMSPEGGVFALMDGKHSKHGTADIDVYLKAHAGDDLIVDRVSRGSVRVERPAMTCAYAIQPEVLAGLRNKSALRHRGALGRFLWARPMSLVGSRQIAPPPVSEQTRQAYRDLVRHLCDSSKRQPQVLYLNRNAQFVFVRWETEIEHMLSDGGDLETVRDWGGKLAGATLRLAAIMHCVTNADPTGGIDTGIIEAAIEIARYLIPHARAVLQTLCVAESVSENDARYLLTWIGRNRLSSFSRRDAHQHGKHRFKTVADLGPALQILIDRNYLRPVEAPEKTVGRPRATVYETNPMLFHGGKQLKKKAACVPANSGNIEETITRESDSGWETVEL